jgi:hypothetical protein
MDFEGTTSVSQFRARSPRETILRWVAGLAKPDSYGLTTSQRLRLIRGYNYFHQEDRGNDFHRPVPLDELESAWCTTVSCIRKGMALLNIIETIQHPKSPS